MFGWRHYNQATAANKSSARPCKNDSAALHFISQTRVMTVIANIHTRFCTQLEKKKEKSYKNLAQQRMTREK